MAKKTKELKTIIINVPKSRRKKFDLSFSKPEQNAVIISSLEGLKANDGWQFLVQTMTKNLEWLSDKIITKAGDNGEELEDAEIEKLRIKYKYLKELIEKPDNFIKRLSKSDEKNPNLDPYD